ncbi:MAG: hypothetical protein OQJ80_00335 [Kangiella sp.]|nr:hypothetical protein [Kangiella sp.]
MSMGRVVGVVALCIILLASLSYCKNGQGERLDIEVVYGYGLKGEIGKALSMLDKMESNHPEDIKFKDKFEQRFKYRKDRTDYLSNKDASLRYLLKIYQDYWREGLLNKSENLDDKLKADLVSFFNKSNKEEAFTQRPININNLSQVFDDYISLKGMHSTGFQKTGKFYDLLVWKTNELEQFEIGLIDQKLVVDVYWMRDFVTLGWTSYARLGERYPGGWATDEALYAVAKGYDKNSEKFKVNYLKHEAQHFSDYQQFPKLKSYDLEYRGKLIELAYGEEYLHDRLSYFIDNASFDKTNAHPYANYCIIRDMSQKIFGEGYVTEKARWNELTNQQIQQAATDLYIANTERLNRLGKETEHYLGEYERCSDFL